MVFRVWDMRFRSGLAIGARIGQIWWMVTFRMGGCREKISVPPESPGVLNRCQLRISTFSWRRHNQRVSVAIDLHDPFVPDTEEPKDSVRRPEPEFATMIPGRGKGSETANRFAERFFDLRQCAMKPPAPLDADDRNPAGARDLKVSGTVFRPGKEENRSSRLRDRDRVFNPVLCWPVSFHSAPPLISSPGFSFANSNASSVWSRGRLGLRSPTAFFVLHRIFML